MIILFGIFHRLANISVSGEVHDGVATAEHLCKFGGIGDVADDEFEPVRQLFVPGGEIVVDNYVVTAAAKRMRALAAGKKKQD